MDLSELRREYVKAGLTEEDAGDDPIELFGRWFEQAKEANRGQWFEPNAMALATATPDGTPSNRIVLLKSFDEAGFVFYTNYSSQKGRELALNPRASAVFHWSELERQVRISGECETVSRAMSQAYHASRPRGSQLGAAVSRQSSVVSSRQSLEAQLTHFEQLYEGYAVPLPADWGGYLLKPRRIEFWQGRENRLHDRLLYERAEKGGWRRVRLSP